MTLRAPGISLLATERQQEVFCKGVIGSELHFTLKGVEKEACG